MLTNKEIKVLLQGNRELSKFARFLKLTPQALYYRLAQEEIRDNLYGAYIEFLLNNVKR